jgi:predicted HicB family RNase H-like nuclease
MRALNSTISVFQEKLMTQLKAPVASPEHDDNGRLANSIAPKLADSIAHVADSASKATASAFDSSFSVLKDSIVGLQGTMDKNISSLFQQSREVSKKQADEMKVHHKQAMQASREYVESMNMHVSQSVFNKVVHSANHHNTIPHILF